MKTRRQLHETSLAPGPICLVIVAWRLAEEAEREKKGESRDVMYQRKKAHLYYKRKKGARQRRTDDISAQPPRSRGSDDEGGKREATRGRQEKERMTELPELQITQKGEEKTLGSWPCGE